MEKLGFVLLAAAGAALVGLSAPHNDETRVDRLRAGDPTFVPNGSQLRLISTGFEEVVADVLWVRSLLVFGESLGGERSPVGAEWLRRTILAITELDPPWRTAYFYGGVLLRVVDDVDGSDEIFKRGADALPDDAFFPFSVGMNAYLLHDDPETAAIWLDRAARCPDAPSWYHAAAASMHQKGQGLDVAIQYLEEVLASSSEEHVRKDNEKKLARLQHQKLVDGWSAACLAHRARTGERLKDPRQLTQLGVTLPANPIGDAWVVGSDGVVRSASMEKLRVKKLRGEELRLMK